MSIEEEIYNKLVEQFGIGEICIKKYGNRPSKTWMEFIKAALEVDTLELYNYCGFSGRSTFSVYFSRQFNSLLSSKDKKQWNTFLLLIVSKKKCPKCGIIKNLIDFSNSSYQAGNLQSICKECTSKYRQDNSLSIKKYKKAYRNKNTLIIRVYMTYYYTNNKSDFIARNAKRRATKLNATPKWADLEAIKEIYKNCPPGYHVDHIIPLQGDLVCGLHVHKNLKPIPAAENLAKGNKFEVS